jgi:1-aminocyclopropane-1-carboxylate deaminase/D-cysteine desulfhydrase-like pyridoxal-dependent ACC family enzyme
MTETIPAPFFPEIVGFSGKLAVIDDRACASPLGGNKARKLLGGLLGEARAHGAKRLFTCGAYGSHHVLATAVHGARAGFEVHAALWPQPETEHVRTVREAGLAAGLVAHHVHSATTLRSAARTLAIARDPKTFFIPLGGSTPRSLEAHAAATRALVARHPTLAGLDAIVVPFGSGGTALGIALGLAQALGDRGPRVHAVVVSAPAFGSTALAAQLLARAVAGGLVGAGTARQAWRRLVPDARFVGAGYGHTTRPAEEALGFARAAGFELEVTYTAKAFAAALTLVRAGERAAYWATLGATDQRPR